MAVKSTLMYDALIDIWPDDHPNQIKGGHHQALSLEESGCWRALTCYDELIGVFDRTTTHIGVLKVVNNWTHLPLVNQHAATLWRYLVQQEHHPVLYTPETLYNIYASNFEMDVIDNEVDMLCAAAANRRDEV